MRRTVLFAAWGILFVAWAGGPLLAQDPPSSPDDTSPDRIASSGSAAGGTNASAPLDARVGWIEIDDAIQPAIAGFLSRALRWAEREGLEALVVAMDTPGGLDTSMRSMIKGILASPVPVIVYVYPPGSRAASAGVFLMMAAHVAAMAPGTNMGAAHPVSLGGGVTGGEAQVDSTMTSKVTNDAVAYARSLATQRGRNADWAERAVRESVSVPADEALELGVIDLVAATPDDLLRLVDGREVELPAGRRPLHTAQARVIELKPNLRDQVLALIANPNVAYLLLLLGVLGIFFELSHPGTLFPGIVGGLAIFLAFFGLQMLPVRAAGIALIVLAVILFILEIKVTSYGALSIGGVAALLFGSLMLFEPGLGVAVSLRVLIPSVIVVGGLFLFAIALAVRAQKRRQVTGAEGLVGEIGEARTDLLPRGRVFVHGEIWSAACRAGAHAGDRVRVLRVNGMELEVEPAGGADPTGP